MPLALIENNPQPQSLQSDEETGYCFSFHILIYFLLKYTI
jgi:hypothetical protein